MWLFPQGRKDDSNKMEIHFIRDCKIHRFVCLCHGDECLCHGDESVHVIPMQTAFQLTW